MNESWNGPTHHASNLSPGGHSSISLAWHTSPWMPSISSTRHVMMMSNYYTIRSWTCWSVPWGNKYNKNRHQEGEALLFQKLGQLPSCSWRGFPQIHTHPKISCRPLATCTPWEERHWDALNFQELHEPDSLTDTPQRWSIWFRNMQASSKINNCSLPIALRTKCGASFVDLNWMKFTAGCGVVSCIISHLLLGDNQQLVISKLLYLSLPWLPRCEERAISLVTSLLFIRCAIFYRWGSTTDKTTYRHISLNCSVGLFRHDHR